MFKRIVLPLAVVLTFLLTALIPAIPPLVKAYVKLAAYDSVYRMNIVIDGKTVGYGTGFFVRAADGSVKVLTNSHVCVDDGVNPEAPGGPLATIKLDDGRELVKEQWDFGNDLCMLHVVGSAALESVVEIAPKAPETGADIYVIGHPFGGSKMISVGHIDSEIRLPVGGGDVDEIPEHLKKYCTLNWEPLAQSQFCTIWRTSNRLNIDIRPGNSGSPILNTKGEVIGVVWGYYPNDARDLGVTYGAVRSMLGFK